MKKTTLILFTILFTSIATSFAQSKSLVGTWKLTAVDIGIEIPEEHRASINQTFQEIIANTSMTFNSDGTVVGNGIDPLNGEKIVENSTYTFDGTTLVTTDSNGEEDSITLPDFDGKNIAIHETESGLNLTMRFVKQ